MNVTKIDSIEPTSLRSTEQMREAYAVIESLEYLQEVARRINLVFESHLIAVASQSIRDSITHSAKLAAAREQIETATARVSGNGRRPRHDA
jgi:hypothetical protein